MPRSTNPNYIDWRKSEAKEIILAHLRNGWLSLDEEAYPAEDVWEYYRHLPEFEGVIFEQFNLRLADHREQIGGRVRRAAWDAAAVEHDKLKHPFPTHNQRGEPNFHGSPAERLLREDVRADNHRGLYSAELQLMRPEYGVFSKKRFKELVKQTIRHVKFENFLAERGRELPFDYRPHP